jgi:hypothetical protein
MHFRILANSGLWADSRLGDSAATRGVFPCGVAHRTCLRWCPALVQRGGFRGGGLFVQVGEYLLDDRRVFDAGNDLHRLAAVVTGFDVDLTKYVPEWN